MKGQSYEFGDHRGYRWLVTRFDTGHWDGAAKPHADRWGQFAVTATSGRMAADNQSRKTAIENIKAAIDQKLETQ